jgi:mono/diheme cytochrome c family protein
LRFFNTKFVKGLALLAALGLLGFWVITTPTVPKHGTPLAYSPNIENGKVLFNAGGCISCHAPSAELKDVAADVPAGGKPLKTPIGTLYPPNLTPDPETGLGKWSGEMFYDAMHQGLAPDGQNYIPAFPYTSYSKLTYHDVMDLWAYLKTIKPIQNAVPPHQVLALPIVRRGLTLWKWLALEDAKWAADPQQSEGWNRGSYLVNSAGHCNECHTPRTFYMASDFTRTLMGGPHPEGKGTVPSLHNLAGRGRYKDVADLVLAFQNGEELGYDKMSSGGMGDVRRNLAMLPEADLKAIAEYVMGLK